MRKPLILILVIFFGLSLLSNFSCNQSADETTEDPAPGPPDNPDPDPDPDLTELFYDDVEHGVKDWVAEETWLIVGGYSYSLTHCWVERNGYYLADQNYSLTSKTFDFTGYENIQMTFWHAYRFEEDYDFGFVEYSIDDGSSWVTAVEITGDKYYWNKLTVEFEASNEPTVKIRFRIVTDHTINMPGWFVDEITILGNEI